MNFRRIVFVSWLALLPLSGLNAAPAPEMVVRVHWLGLKQISADTNTAHLKSIWHLPQTTGLVSQTLDKCSRWPGGGATNAASARLRPLLDDLIASEFYLEVDAPAGASSGSTLETQNAKLLLALRLSAERARLWQANLPAALKPVEFSHAGEWTLVGIGNDTAAALSDFATRLRAPSTANFWLEADLAPSRLWEIFPPTGGSAGWSGLDSIFHFPSALTNLHFTVTGETGNVLTRATFDFSRPLDLTLPPWEIPTNLFQKSLNQFTAVRGVPTWLTNCPAWQEHKLPPPPDQMFWFQSGMPFQAFIAAPLPSASNQLSQLATWLVPAANAWLATHGEGHVQWQTNLSSLVWKEANIMAPFIRPVKVNHRNFLLGGMMPLPSDEFIPLPATILRPVLETTNLVCYQAELTGSLTEDDLYVSQMLRLIFRKAQLTPEAAQWLIKLGPLLGGCATAITQTGSQQLVLTRSSTLGITALELHLLADWLESPEFPCGLHTFLTPPDQ